MGSILRFVCTVCVTGASRSEEDTGSPEIGVTDVGAGT